MNAPTKHGLFQGAKFEIFTILFRSICKQNSGLDRNLNTLLFFMHYFVVIPVFGAPNIHCPIISTLSNSNTFLFWNVGAIKSIYYEWKNLGLGI